MTRTAPTATPIALDAIFRRAHIGVITFTADGSITGLNRAAYRALGCPTDELPSRERLLAPYGREERQQIMRVFRRAARVGYWSGKIALRHPDGSLHHTLLSLSAIRDSAQKVLQYIGLLDDDSRLGDNIKRAHFDALTGLPNRLLLKDRLEQAIAANRRNGTLLAVCFMDLDGFKQVNDTLGHAAGDALLKFVAGRMLYSLRDSDTVARVGGDEFVMLLSGLETEDECRMALNRLLSQIAEPYTLKDNRQASISISIGVAMFPADDADPDVLIGHADQAMYAAKKAGKNRFQMFDARLEERMQARQQMLRRVALALKNQQFVLHYHPKVDFASGRVIGVEALIRWHHPILGNLAPGEFIPLIEDDELARPLGNWVLATALAQARRWHEAGLALSVSVNTFARQMLAVEFPRLLKGLIGEVWPDMPAGKLYLEILETPGAQALPRLEESIQACRALGVRFTLDDYGIGPSSLHCLRSLSLDEIKIYQSLSAHGEHCPDPHLLVRSIVDLAHAFKLQVVAEGVETPAAIAEMRALGCSVMQGYAIAQPMPSEQIPDWLATFSPAACQESS